jgi:glycosyltransferase involved in cell wall biosynthesis
MNTLSVIIPALNESGNLALTVAEVLEALNRARCPKYELLIFNDASSDDTGTIAEELARRDARISVIHNPRTMGLGYNFWRGVQLASCDYVTMIPGDNEIKGESVTEMLKMVGQKDIIIGYPQNPEVRPPLRQMISRTFTLCMNRLFRLSLHYYNGPCVYRRALLDHFNLRTNGFAYMAAINVVLLRRGHSYLQHGYRLRTRPYGGSKALRIKNILSVGWTILRLLGICLR